MTDSKEKRKISDKGIMHQITSTKAVIDKSYYRISVIERMLAATDMEEDRRKELETELHELKQILKLSEREIETLHSSNRETTKIAAVVMFIVVFLICIYAILSNTN